MSIRDLTTYEIIKEEELKGIHAKGYLLRHRKTKARVLLIENDDNNKVFNIGFRTPPSDSTGVPHIMEHSVLCGSKNFPAKDPFVELVKGSLNTFLNAMTYPDKTMYPVASCNDKDFQDLMHVYMDAVFYPNIYEHEEIFRQEGWSYKLDSKDDALAYNGVVYNEMKGAFSSPEGVLDRVVLNTLFPDTSYANESGGDPDVIPELTYEQFLDFHRKYYHPSNSYIYLYGDMDMEEKLEWLDKNYLSNFEEEFVDSAIMYQQPFEKMVEKTIPYSIASEESEEDNTYLSYNKVIATSLDKELYLAFQILDYALLSAPGAPLKKALTDAEIGKDIMGSYDNGIYQPIFSIVAKNANEDQKQAFVDVIEEVLSDIVIEDEAGMKQAAKYIGDTYGCAVLIKGGHSINDANDLLYEGGNFTWFKGKRIANNNTHGTGCTLSSAIASNLAKGFDLKESIEKAKEYISCALNARLDLGKGSGPMMHNFDLQGKFSKEAE